MNGNRKYLPLNFQPRESRTYLYSGTTSGSHVVRRTYNAVIKFMGNYDVIKDALTTSPAFQKNSDSPALSPFFNERCVLLYRRRHLRHQNANKFPKYCRRLLSEIYHRFKLEYRNATCQLVLISQPRTSSHRTRHAINPSTIDIT